MPETALPPIIGLEQFRVLAYKDAPIDPTAQLVCRDFDGDKVEVTATSKTGTFDFVMSTQSVDRDQDTISAEGFDLASYRKAPIWLAFHDPREFIGVSTDIGVEKDKLLSTLKLGPTPMAKLVKEMIEFRLETKALEDAGASASVGFLPIDVDRAPKDSGRAFGLDFKEQELLENSHVPIGSNRDALLRAKAAGIDFGVAADWASRYRQLESGLLTVNLATAVAIVKALDPPRGMALFSMPPSEIVKLRRRKAEPASGTSDPEGDGTEAESVAAFAKYGDANESLIGKISELVDVLAKSQQPPRATEDPPSVREPDEKAMDTAYEKLTEAYILDRADDEIIRRTGVIPTP